MNYEKGPFSKKAWLKQVLIQSAKINPEAKFRPESGDCFAPGISPFKPEYKSELSALYKLALTGNWVPNTWETIDKAFTDLSGPQTLYYFYKDGKFIYCKTTREKLIQTFVEFFKNLGKKLKDRSASTMEIETLLGYDWGLELAKLGQFESGNDYRKLIDKYEEDKLANDDLGTSDPVSTPTSTPAGSSNSPIDPNATSKPKFRRTRGNTSSDAKKSRISKDRVSHTHDNKLSPIVRDLLSDPLKPLPMTGQDGHIFRIEQETDSTTSSKTPMALIMPLTGRKETPRRVNRDNGVVKNKVRVSASVDSPETFVIYFNTLKEAEDFKDKIIASANVPERIAPGVDVNRLVVVGINIVSRDPALTKATWDKYKRLFYPVDTDLGPVWIMAQHLNEAFKNISGEPIKEEIDPEENVQNEIPNSKKVNQNKSRYFDFDTYEEAFLRE